MFCRDDSSKWHCLPSARLDCYCGDCILMLIFDSSVFHRAGAAEVKGESAAAHDSLAAHLQNGEDLKVEIKGESKAAPAFAHRPAEGVPGRPLSCP